MTRMRLRAALGDVARLLLLAGLVRVTLPQTAPVKDPSDSPYRLSVNVDLVVLHATVRERSGRTVSGLGKENFQIYEDGVPQSIRLFRHEDIPVTVGLVIDHSGSVRPKLPDVIAAARAFAESSNPEDEMFVVNFNENVTLGLPAGVLFTNRSDELGRAISQTPAAGQTALYDAVGEALERLQSGSRDKKVLVVISDGGDNTSKRTLPQLLLTAEQSSALIYTIGIFDQDDPDRNAGVLRRLARVAGGEAFFPGQLSEVTADCERIARDIRSQYTLGYVPGNTAPQGAYRSIRVGAAADGYGRLQVRARTGYVTGRAGGTGSQ